MARSFYCDNCGEKVSPDQERCPGCGRFFRAVKCPVCGYSGEGGEFLKGCPVCGYLKEKEIKERKKRPFWTMSRLFAYSAITFLSLLLIFLIYVILGI